MLDANGVPETRQCMVRLSQCEILDTWYTTGLRGTGSNDLLAKDVFVEAGHTFSFQDKELIKRPGPLYAFPFMFAAKTSPIALGIARHAVDVLIEAATNKMARRYTVGDHLEPAKMMRDDVFIQEAVGVLTLCSPPHAPTYSRSWATCGRLWSVVGNPRPPKSRASPLLIRTWLAFAWT